jgi:UDP-N-acetylmuramate: L-alanyl-gamma-D-glutamyl-meso-diaminopimelate ligase
MKRLHFIAIGGSAMHNLALALKAKGCEVSGSDDAIFEPSKSRLEKAGLLPVELGWDETRITPELDGVILGMHAKKDNPELLAAQALGVKIYSYPEFLYEQSKTKTRVVIAGSHGKTSITAMVLHVLNYHDIEVDFMVGAQLEGFDTMVHLTDSNDFMLIEGDEYLSSPVDLQPKFLWYKPHVTLISGIAWDHINVFPTLTDYEDQFRKYIETIVPGGAVVYNKEDAVLTRLILQSENTIRRQSYQKPAAIIEQGVTYLQTEEGDLPLSVFGDHNLSNLAGAKWICQLMGVDEMDFYEAIESFKGAAKRLERVAEGKSSYLFKDFAHAPSKVTATVKAVTKQFEGFTNIGCLELHTYSSLDPEFLPNYKDSLTALDEAIVFYDPEALKIKGRPAIATEEIKAAFGLTELQVFTNPASLHRYLLEKNYDRSVLLMMSSGNYGGLDWALLSSAIA